MTIKSFSPTSDWYFVFKDIHGKRVNYRLAGFAVMGSTDDSSDRVVGLVPVTGGGPTNTIMPGVCQLAVVPPVEGTYVHQDDLEPQGD